MKEGIVYIFGRGVDQEAAAAGTKLAGVEWNELEGKK